MLLYNSFILYNLGGFMNNKFKNIFALILCVSLMVFTTGCQSSNDTISSLEQLNSSEYTVGVPQGAAAMYAGEEYFDNAEIIYYTSTADAYAAIEYGKLDAFVFDSHTLEYAAINNDSISIMPDSKISDEYIVIGSTFGNEELIEQVNEFIALCYEDGTYDDMYSRWIEGESSEMPEIEVASEPTMTLVVGTDGTNEPMNYYSDGGELVGFDVEFAQRLALYLNAELQIETMTFDALFSSVSTGKIDLLMANLNETDAIKEIMLVSDSYIVSEVCVIINSDRVDETETTETNLVPLYDSVEEMAGMTFGVVTGSSQDVYTGMYIEDANILYYEDFSDLPTALALGKIDGYLMDEPIARVMVSQNSSIIYDSDYIILEESYAYAMRQNDDEKIKTELNAYIQYYIDSGKIDTLQDKWFGDDDSVKTAVDLDALDNSNGTIKIGVVPSLEPFAYISNGEIIGYDIDLIYDFCEENSYGLEIIETEASSFIEALQTGEFDILCGYITVTEERAEVVEFLTPNYTGGQVLVVEAVEAEEELEAVPKYTEYEELEGLTLSSLSGTVFDTFIAECLDDFEMLYFNDLSSQAEAVLAGKVEAMFTDAPVAELIVSEVDGLTLMPEYLIEDSYGIALQKDSDLTDDFNAVLEQFYEDGTMDYLVAKWINGEYEKVLPDLDYSEFEETLIYAHDVTTEPMSYIGDDGGSLGYDVELVMLIAYELNMKVEFVQTSFDSLIQMLASGKADVATGAMSITEERAESVDFTNPYYEGGVVGIVLDVSGIESDEEGFMNSLVDSFIKNFITESRWKLIVQGIGTTLIITIFAGILGTAFGFLICLMKLSKNKFSTLIANIYIRLFQGTPIVVILMILYYLVFGSVNISSTIVAILAFGFNFAAYVSEMMRTGIEAVDNGQREAAYAIGFSKTKTFVKIIFPQAAKHFLPVFRGEFINLLKTTSIVGYIAIQDLTKMSDIIRSRTYEAFFPLISTAIIYFILAYLLTLFITVIEKRIDPKSRKRALKGVNVK